MNIPLAIAAVLSILMALVHTVMGERLIFSKWRKTQPPLPRAHSGIIWASWHILSVFGVALAGVLFHYSLSGTPMPPLLRVCFIITFVISSALVLLGTRGRHPAWAVFLILGCLIIAASPF